MVMPQVAALLKGRYVDALSIKQYSKNKSKQPRSINVKKTNDVKATAALLRASPKRKS